MQSQQTFNRKRFLFTNLKNSDGITNFSNCSKSHDGRIGSKSNKISRFFIRFTKDMLTTVFYAFQKTSLNILMKRATILTQDSNLHMKQKKIEL